MRIFIFTLAAAITISNFAYAETIRAGVNGMVCAFCATGIEKSFKGQPSVDDVKVDLETKMVTIKTKEGQNLPDDTVRKIITDAGYSVTDIQRGDGDVVKK